MVMSIGARREFILAAEKARALAWLRGRYADRCEHDIRRFNIPSRLNIKLEGRPTKIGVEADLQRMREASVDLARIFQHGRNNTS
jgi:hypothetical protein